MPWLICAPVLLQLDGSQCRLLRVNLLVHTQKCALDEQRISVEMALY